MINETASSTDDRPSARSSVRDASHGDDARSNELRVMVSTVLIVEKEDFDPELQALMSDGVLLLNPNSRPVATFSGRLMLDSEEAYDRLDTLAKALDYVPVFRENDERQVIHILSGRAKPTRRSC
jgi:hypothetical protein